MAVDANILIFERLKEELRAGKAIHAAIDAGFSRAFTSIFDSNVTTWIVCAILIWLGAPIIKGFAITLAIGVAVSMFTAITVTRSMLHVVTEMEWARNPALYGLNVGWLNLVFPAAREGGVLRVFDKRRIYLGISLITAVIALVFIAMTPFGMGLRPGIDFTGGSAIEAAYRDKTVNREDVMQVLQKHNLADAVVSVGRSEQPWTTVNIEANDVDLPSQEKVQQRLANIRGFDTDSVQKSVEGKTFKLTATFTAPVTEADVRAALNTKSPTDDVNLDLKSPKITTTAINHMGAEAIPVVLIRSKTLRPDVMQALRADLDQLKGGIIEPMYQASSIGPSVATEVTANAFWSVLVASLAIVLYLAFRFAIGGFINGLKFGVCAVIALVHDVCIVIGLFALMGWLRGWEVDSLFVTAALTILGFSVHDTIVVYDRIRENLMHRRKGETFAEVSDRSITQTFDRSINTSFTVLLVVAALVFFGGESIRLFNLALLIGIAIGTYSSIFVASPLVVMLERAVASRTAQATPAPAPRRETAVAGAGRGPSPRPASSGTRATATRPAPESTDGAAADGAEERPGSAPRPGTVRPKRKRRL
jgi:preprotein translocase SecF subunit